MRNVDDAKHAGLHAFTQQVSDRSEQVLDGAVGVLFLFAGTGEIVVLEQRAQEQACRSVMLGKRVDERIDPAIDARQRIATRRQRRGKAAVENIEQAPDHGGVQLGLASEMMKER